MLHTQRDLAPGEWSVLALLAEKPSHGWALARELARTEEVGQVWAVGRPLVYRAIEMLEGRGLIEPIGEERGTRGPNRTLYAATTIGREKLYVWLEEPVEHMREVRSLFLLKLVLLVRSGLPTQSLLDAQRELVAPAVEGLEDRLATSSGTERVFTRFRLETTRAVLSFIDSL